MDHQSRRVVLQNMSLLHERSHCFVFNSVYHNASHLCMRLLLFLAKVNIVLIGGQNLVSFPVVVCKDDELNVLGVALEFLKEGLLSPERAEEENCCKKSFHN